MGGVLKTVVKVASVVAAVALAIPSGGTSLLAAGLGVSSMAAVGITAGLALGSSLLAGKPKPPETSPSNADRLQANVDPRAPRKIIFGRTAMATDIRDQEFSDNQELLHRFIVVASHRTSTIREIWLDDKLAWSDAGGIQGEFVGYLGVECYPDGNPANAKNIGPRMGASRRYTGLAWVYLRFKLTGNDKKAESPFAQSIPSRVTIIGDGALVYDPRRDSTQPGGSGPQRIDDQTTWQWDDNASRNPALQMLWYLIGWRIQNPSTAQWRLAVGKGIPARRIDIASFMTAANMCDEPVVLASGGTQPRYRSDGIFSEADATSTVLDNLKASMNGELDDVDGRIRLTILHNDLATPIASFSEDDILGGVKWSQTAPLSDSFNIVRGGYVDPSTESLYQMVDYPQVSIPSPDGIDRIETIDFPMVQSPGQAQRLAKQRIARMLYSGTFQATFSYRAWKVQKGDIIRQSFAPFGWTNRLFRVVETSVQVDGTVPMLLREEHPDIYLWDADERPAIQPVAPTTYDPYLNPIYQDVVVPKYADGTPIDNERPSDPDSPIGNAGMTIGQFLALQAQAEQDIAALGVVTSGLQSDAADLESRIHAAEGTISTQTTEIAANGSRITEAFTAIDSIEGQLADLTITVRASTNLLRNSTFEEGLAGWIASDGNWFTGTDINFGSVAFRTVGGVGVHYLYRDHRVSENITFTATAEPHLYISGAGYASCYMQWLNDGGEQIVDGYRSGAATPAPIDWQNGNATREVLKVTGTCPVGATVLRVVLNVVVESGTIAYAGWRRAKLEQGSDATPYSQEASVAQTFKAINSTDLQVASLTSDISTIDSRVTTSAQAISGLESNYASLSSLVATQGASITSNANAISTTNSNLGTLATTVSVSAPNLLRYGSFPNGLQGWPVVVGPWGASSPVDANWGSFVYVTGTGGNYYVGSNIQVVQTGQVYTISADIDRGGTTGGNVAARIIWTNGGSVVGVGAAAVKYSGSFSNDARNRVQATTAPCPAGVDGFYVDLCVEGASPGNNHFRQIKVNVGAQAGYFTDEATVSQTFQSLSTLTTQYASLSSDVSVMGVDVSTSLSAINDIESGLAGTYQMVIDANGRIAYIKAFSNGQQSALDFNFDNVRFLSSGNNRSEIRSGTFFCYTGGQKRVQLGDLSIS